MCSPVSRDPVIQQHDPYADRPQQPLVLALFKRRKRLFQRRRSCCQLGAPRPVRRPERTLAAPTADLAAVTALFAAATAPFAVPTAQVAAALAFSFIGPPRDVPAKVPPRKPLAGPVRPAGVLLTPRDASPSALQSVYFAWPGPRLGADAPARVPIVHHALGPMLAPSQGIGHARRSPRPRAGRLLGVARYRLPMHFRPGRRQPFSSHRATGGSGFSRFLARDWTHGIDLKHTEGEASRRVSATFRTLAFQFERSA